MKNKQLLNFIKKLIKPKCKIFKERRPLILYLICLLQLVSFKGFSQDTILLNEKNSSLVSNNTNVRFQYKKKDIILTINKKNKEQKKQLQLYSISGTVKDASTGETLLGASVLILNNSKGVITNEYGFYSISLAKNVYTVQYSYIGFKTKEIELNLSENKKIDIELRENSNNLEEVLITSKSTYKSQVKSVLLGVSSLKATDIKKLPSLLGEPDVTRAILTQPGVSSIGEGTSGFNVRGGNIDQNLILLDEAPIYNSSHIWGFFSIFNADAIKDLKLYKGGIPARFGGRASSVLDIRQREGSNKKFKGQGGIGLLFSRLTLEGPIKKEKLNFLVSGRRSYFDLFFPLAGDDLKNSKVYFYDLNTKITWNINAKNTVFVSGYFGADVMKFGIKGETNSDGSKDKNEKVDFRWKNATATLRWNRIFSDKLFMNLSAIYSRYNYALSSENDSGGGPINNSGNFQWSSSVENWIFKPDFTYYKDSETKIRFGINSTLYLFSPTKITGIEKGINDIDFKTEKGLEIAPYISYKKDWNKLSMSAGLRYSWFGNFGPFEVASYKPNLPKSANSVRETKFYKKGEIIKSYGALEPRLSFNYHINDYNSLKFGYNRMFQYIHLISNTSAALPFDIWKLSGLYIPPIEVNQISMGYAFDTTNGTYNFSLEGYYKTFKNMVEYKNGANLFLKKNLETELLPAKGYSSGLEFGAYKTSGKLTGNLNYTYSVTKRKTTSPYARENINNGNYYPSNYDKPHILNLTANYKLSKKWSLGSFFTYQSGRSATVPNGRLLFNGNSYINYSNRNGFRISDTHRMDISFTYSKNNPNKNWKGSWTFGVYNVYSNKNAFSVYSKFKKGQLKTYQFSVVGSVIPFITYNFKF